MHSRRMLLILLCTLFPLIGGFLLPISAHAQEEPDTTDQQLPEIAPREIEIRGELDVSFPALERQPLSGFAAPPKVPSVPPDRLPYAEGYKQTLAHLPESLPTPDVASKTVSQVKPAEEGFLQVGAGRYASRFAEGRYFFDVTPDQSLSFHADYYGTEGFSPFSGAASNLDTPSDEFDGSIQFESRHDGFAIRTDVHGLADSYTLYGRPSLGGTNAGSDAPDRSGVSGGLTANLHTFGSVDSEVGVGYDRTSYETDPISSASTATFQEDRFQFNGEIRLPIGSRETRFDIALDRANYESDVSSSSGFSVSGGAGLPVFRTGRLTVNAGVRVLSFEAPTAPSQPNPGSVNSTYLLPEVRAEFVPSSNLTLFAENQPILKSDGLLGLYAENPYVAHAPAVQPTVFTTNTEAGLITSFGPVRLQSRVGFRYAPSYRAFTTPVDGTGTPNGALQVGYGSARIVRGGGQLALEGVENVEASIEAFYRNGTLTGLDEDIPYFSPFVSRAMLSVSFADQKGLVQTTGTIEGARTINPGSDRDVASYVSFDVEGSYRITSLLDAVLAVRDLSPSAPKRWARYPRPPTTLSAGFRIHW